MTSKNERSTRRSHSNSRTKATRERAGGLASPGAKAPGADRAAENTARLKRAAVALAAELLDRAKRPARMLTVARRLGFQINRVDLGGLTSLGMPAHPALAIDPKADESAVAWAIANACTRSELKLSEASALFTNEVARALVRGRRMPEAARARALQDAPALLPPFSVETHNAEGLRAIAAFFEGLPIAPEEALAMMNSPAADMTRRQRRIYNAALRRAELGEVA